MSTPAVLLRTYPYGDSSRVLRFYARDLGLVGILARGVRGKGGKQGSGLGTFASGVLTAYVRPHRDLHTMKEFHAVDVRTGLGSDVLRFAAASTVAELLLGHTEQEAQPGLYDTLEAVLDSLRDGDPALLPTLAVSSLWRMVVALGYAPSLRECVRCGRVLGGDEMGRFHLAAGGVCCAECDDPAVGPRVGPTARRHLEDLLAGVSVIPVAYPRRHLALVADFVGHHLVHRPLKSLGMLVDLLPVDDGSGT
ncbi:MAG: DNA repair protein RecO [Gemmatimonadota bacterium]|nr:DNA repair protein RecO [Gemmatimonadota bacterium]MDH5760158.1 DNA repair protein RecO [Gemmatimonadota bacterium]